jgi:nucleoside 2-deoxyribosyltransferase
MTARVNLAGPEVFLANAREIGLRKRVICERHGLVGIFPGDEEESPSPALAGCGNSSSGAADNLIRCAMKQ